MNRKEADKLKLGDRVVIWADTENEAHGEVIEHGYCASKFKWDDGEVSVIHANDMVNVMREPVREAAHA
jgi:hypothetical protein